MWECWYCRNLQCFLWCNCVFHSILFKVVLVLFHVFLGPTWSNRSSGCDRSAWFSCEYGFLWSHILLDNTTNKTATWINVPVIKNIDRYHHSNNTNTFRWKRFLFGGGSSHYRHRNGSDFSIPDDLRINWQLAAANDQPSNTNLERSRHLWSSAGDCSRPEETDSGRQAAHQSWITNHQRKTWYLAVREHP